MTIKLDCPSIRDRYMRARARVCVSGGGGVGGGGGV